MALPETEDITFKVLGFYDEQEKEWNAVALEMDIWGRGKTLQEAHDELEDLVLMQISFALHQGKPEMIWCDADPVYFQHFADAVARQLNIVETHFISTPHSNYDIKNLPYPSPQVIAQKRKEFAETA